MPQISKGDTFADSQQLTADRLNKLVDSAKVLVGAITEQTSITANTLEATDTTIVNDGGVLRQASVGDILNSGIPVTTPTINSTANNDISVNPYDGVNVLGSNYISADGITVTVTTLSPHGLAVNNVVLISSAGSGYNGVFRVTEVTTNTFKYVLPVKATTLTPTPTACTYKREGTQIVNGQQVVVDNQFVNGKINAPTVEATNITSKDATLETLNATSAIQFAGTPVYALKEVTVNTFGFFQCDATTEAQRIATCNQWLTAFTVPSLNKTNKEIWYVDIEIPFAVWSLFQTKIRVTRNSDSSIQALQTIFYNQNFGGSTYHRFSISMRFLIPEATVFTNETLNIQVRYDAGFANASAICAFGYGGSMTEPSTTRNCIIHKYIKP